MSKSSMNCRRREKGHGQQKGRERSRGEVKRQKTDLFIEDPDLCSSISPILLLVSPTRCQFHSPPLCTLHEEAAPRAHLQYTAQRPPLQLSQTANDGARPEAPLLAHDDTRVRLRLHEEVQGGDDGGFVDGVRGVDVLGRGRGRMGGRADLVQGDRVGEEELLAVRTSISKGERGGREREGGRRDEESANEQGIGRVLGC
jgi:hypothetical protein